ncbi:uncharacterized protein LTR77_006931 [Saxophila tyrrhenica]|uniref:Uncharacterized protein n=1 Tax=Saxophila tyrrhenica TaxID=1690608 RepID=A0AAV9PAC6_9PEZI|nr:hypothetical protein LTR77_006931 [Saxophila tyrrhenica]
MPKDEPRLHTQANGHPDTSLDVQPHDRKKKHRNRKRRGQASSMTEETTAVPLIQIGSSLQQSDGAIVQKQTTPGNEAARAEDLPPSTLEDGRMVSNNTGRAGNNSSTLLARAGRTSGLAAVQWARRPKKRWWLGNTSKGWVLPRCQQDLVATSQTGKEFAWALLKSVPAVLYTFTGLASLFLKSHAKVQFGFQIANAVLLVVLSGMGLSLGRFNDENRWYMRHYFVWTIISHVAAYFFGCYTQDSDGSELSALDLFGVVQAVQTFPFWSVELFGVGGTRLEKRQ